MRLLRTPFIIKGKIVNELNGCNEFGFSQAKSYSCNSRN